MKNLHLFYWFAVYSVRLWAAVWFRIEYIGRGNIPEKGGCIIAANHASFLDPPLIGTGVSARRIVRFVARATLRKSQLAHWVYDHLLTIPLDRTKGDLKAMRTVLGHLAQGEVVALFPEGTRSEDGQLQQAKAGIGFMIVKAGVPVVPTRIEGSFEAYPRGARFIRPRKIRVIFGKPVQPEEIKKLGDGKEVYALAGDHIMRRIGELGPEEQ